MKKGQQVRVVDNVTSHGFDIGEVVQLHSVGAVNIFHRLGITSHIIRLWGMIPIEYEPITIKS